MEHSNGECNCSGKFCMGCEQVICIEGFPFKYDKNRGKSYPRSRCRLCFRKLNTGYSRNLSAKTVENRKQWKREYLKRETETVKKLNEHKKRQSKKWSREHPERIRKRRETPGARKRAIESRKKWNEKHPEKIGEYNQINANNRRAWKRQTQGTFSAQEWEQIKSKYQYTCLGCQRKEPEIKLTIDHVIPLARGGPHTADNIQPLCKICNSKKWARTIDYRITKMPLIDEEQK